MTKIRKASVIQFNTLAMASVIQFITDTLASVIHFITHTIVLQMKTPASFPAGVPLKAGKYLVPTLLQAVDGYAKASIASRFCKHC